MQLIELVFETQLRESLNILMMDYIDLVHPSLMESVTSDCKYKKEIIHNKKKIVLAGLDGITDLHIETLDDNGLKELLNKINRHSDILLTATDCEKAVKERFKKLNPEKTRLSSFDKILDELRNTVKEYIKLASSKPYSLKVYVPTKNKNALGIKENLNIDEVILRLSVFNSINSTKTNTVDLSETLIYYTDLLIEKMNNITESIKYDTVTFSDYIAILKWIRKQLAGSLIEQGLLDVISKYKSHYDRFVELNKSNQ
jgi:predicted transposase YbfD/YdcC